MTYYTVTYYRRNLSNQLVEDTNHHFDLKNAIQDFYVCATLKGYPKELRVVENSPEWVKFNRFEVNSITAGDFDEPAHFISLQRHNQ